MATTTFSGVLRAAHGDNQKIVTPGAVVLARQFFLDTTATAATPTNVFMDSAYTKELILPKNTIILSVDAVLTTTGGSSPTWDLGYLGYTDATENDPDGLIAEGDATSGSYTFTAATTEAGVKMGTVLSATQPVYLTANEGDSAPTSSVIVGTIQYTVSDSGAWG